MLSSSTLSSSKIFKKFKFKKTFHQFYPIDSPFIINMFLNYWKPYAVFFVESEIWPEMLKSLKQRQIKIFLLNARISKNLLKGGGIYIKSGLIYLIILIIFFHKIKRL